MGLGKMGMNMVQRLLNDGHEIIAYARTAETVKKAEDIGAAGATSLSDIAGKLDKPRVVWLMVPSGKATEDTLNSIAESLEDGDVLIDGGNSHFQDTDRRLAELDGTGIQYIGMGVSGGEQAAG